MVNGLSKNSVLRLRKTSQLALAFFSACVFIACGSSDENVSLGADSSVESSRGTESVQSVLSPGLPNSSSTSNPSSNAEGDSFLSLGIASPETSGNSTSGNSTSDNSTSAAPACPTLVPGAPLGISCLHCAAPGARAQAQVLAEVMASSCRENLATTMLVDGTFGDDRDFLGELVRIMGQNGARVHLFLYLGNGPWQRSYSSVPSRGFGSKISPDEFRARIQSDEGLRNEYRNVIKQAEPLMNYAQSLGAVIYLLPMLEDNLDAASARAMEALTVETVLPTIGFALGRNPCPNCYGGNDTSIPAGVFADQHIHALAEGIQVSNGLVTNDGKTFTFPGESLGNAGFNFDELRQAARDARSRNNSFVIWRHNFQGLATDGGLIDPNNRTYVTPTQEQIQALLSLLRE